MATVAPQTVTPPDDDARFAGLMRDIGVKLESLGYWFPSPSLTLVRP